MPEQHEEDHAAKSGASPHIENAASLDKKDEVQAVVYRCPIDHSGGTIYLKGWIVEDSELPPIVIVHDLGEGVRFYRSLAVRLHALGFSTFCFDLRGHGRSGPVLGHAPSFHSLVKDLLQVGSWVRFKSGRRLPILMSQGVGSLITTYFQEIYPEYINHHIAISPHYKLSNTISRSTRLFVKMFGELSPRFKLPKALSLRLTTFGSGLPSKRQKAFKGVFSFGLLKELLQALEGLPDVFIRCTHDCLIIIPQQVTEYDGIFVKNLLAKHPLRDKLLLLELGNISAHPLTEKEEYAVVLNSVLPWLEARLNRPILSVN